MAGLLLQRKTMMDLTVVRTPVQQLALTNLAYCCRSDHHNFSASGSELFLASVHDHLVLSLLPHDAIQPGHIALSRIQRQVARVSVGGTVRASRFIPPADFDLALLSLELEFLDGGINSVQLDATVLANHLREKFYNQVLTVGQKVAFEYDGNRFFFTVTQAILQGRKNSKSDPGRGMISVNTAIVSGASSARIKIVNGGEASTSKLGSNDLKRMLLYCPPTTSKTQVACQRMKMQNGEEPKIHGVEPLNNVSLTGITNLLDKMLLRVGELEVLDEISRPDEYERLQIFQIHTNKMKENSYLSADVNLWELAARTKNYTGADIRGVVRSAVSFALNGQLSLDDLTKPIDEESIRVTMEDFLKALQEITPAFGAFDAKKMLIKKLYTAVDTASMGKDSGSSEAIYIPGN